MWKGIKKAKFVLKELKAEIFFVIERKEKMKGERGSKEVSRATILLFFLMPSNSIDNIS